MTTYHDPDRPRLLNQQPCWLGTLISLPRLEVWPTEGSGTLDISLWHFTGTGFSRQTIQIGYHQISQLLEEWALDPESTLKSRWALNPPALGSSGHSITKGQGHEIVIASEAISDEDLGI
jgi:hypothetical protein